MITTWYAYECHQCGALVDLAAMERDPPPMICPIDGSSMSFDGSWPNDEGGYGSRSDGIGGVIRRLDEILSILDTDMLSDPDFQVKRARSITKSWLRKYGRIVKR